jgi:hypothetical protein
LVRRPHPRCSVCGGGGLQYQLSQGGELVKVCMRSSQYCTFLHKVLVSGVAWRGRIEMGYGCYLFLRFCMGRFGAGAVDALRWFETEVGWKMEGFRWEVE